MEHKADAQPFQDACFGAGPEGEREWFEYKTRYSQWRWRQTVPSRHPAEN